MSKDKAQSKAILSSADEMAIGEKLKEMNPIYYFAYRLLIETGVSSTYLFKLKVRDLVDKDNLLYPKRKTKEEEKMVKCYIQPISPSLKKELADFFESKNPNDYALSAVTDPTKPLYYVTLQAALNSVTKKLGIESITLNSLRKTFLYHVYQRDGVNEVKRILRTYSDEKALSFIGLSSDGTPPAAPIVDIIQDTSAHINSLFKYVELMLKDSNIPSTFTADTEDFIREINSACDKYEKKVYVPSFLLNKLSD